MHRFLLTIAMLLVLAGGQFVPRFDGSSAQAAAADQVAPLEVNSPDHSMGGNCGTCARDESGQDVCLSTCVGAQVVLPEGLAVPVVATIAHGFPADDRMTGPSVRPEPHPPKHLIRS
jgi:ABC-type dipeptide/oligopeptide/nickel transport system permease subunit